MSALQFDGVEFDRASIPKELRTELWPTVDPAALDEKRKDIFERRAQAMRLFVDTTLSTTKICQQTGIARTDLHRQLSRCIQLNPDGRIMGFRALIPHARLDAYNRRAPVKVRRDGKGTAGAFTRLLKQYPELEQRLQKEVRKRFRSITGPDEVRPSIKQIYAAFVRWCRKLPLGPDDYPFNIGGDRKSYIGAKRSIERYVQKFRTRDFDTAAAEAGAEHVGKRWFAQATSSAPVIWPLDCVEFDGHRIDARLTISVPDPYGMETCYEIERIWILAIKCIGSRAILGYSLALGANYSADDVMEAVKAALLPHRRPTITIPELTYDPQGGFPSEVIPEARFACWSRMRMDNAGAHQSASPLSRICEFIGARAEFGQAGEPDDRPFVESGFRLFSRNFAHRLPGTTGNHPDDMRRALADPKGNLRLLIPFHELEQVVDVLVSDSNGTPHGGLGGRTPLEAFKYFVERNPTTIRALSKHKRSQMHLLQECVIKPIKGSAAEGVRAHINFAYVRYSNDALSSSAALIGKQLRIYYDPKDIRMVRAYFENGEELGVLTAARPWLYTPHSLKTRLEIERLKTHRKLRVREGEDPVLALLKYKRGKASKSRRQATGLAKMLRSVNKGQAEPQLKKEPKNVVRPAQSTRTDETPKVIELRIKKAVVF